ncbi:hypothetical protein GJ496_003467 [Pomphorhynchus laevis]|nr:hypothetical protein GJ496_003467 [Pomphorhynchus laevis]
MPMLCSDIILGYPFLRKHQHVTFKYNGPCEPLMVGASSTMLIECPPLFSNITENIRPIAIPSLRTGCTPHKLMFLHDKRSASDNSLPTWLTNIGSKILVVFSATPKVWPYYVGNSIYTRQSSVCDTKVTRKVACLLNIYRPKSLVMPKCQEIQSQMTSSRKYTYTREKLIHITRQSIEVNTDGILHPEDFSVRFDKDEPNMTQENWDHHQYRTLLSRWMPAYLKHYQC